MAAEALTSIVVPVDGSTGGARAARFAATLAAAASAELVLLFAVPAAAGDPMGLMGFQNVPSRHLHMSEADNIQQALARAAEKAFASAREASGAAVSRQEIARGQPAEAIIDYARRHGTCLIVMGSRGLSRMQEVVLGSVSDRVVRHAPCRSPSRAEANVQADSAGRYWP